MAEPIVSEDRPSVQVVPVSPPTLAAARRYESLGELIEGFLSGLDVAGSSRATYQRTLRHFVSWLEVTDRATRLNTLQREDILAYKAALQAEGKSAYSVSSYLTSVRKFFEYLETEKVYPNIARGVKGAQKPRGFRKDTLTPPQLRESLNSIDRGSLAGMRDYAMFNLMARTGLRTIEVSRATVGDLRQEGGQAVLYVQGKGRDTADEFVLLTEETLRPILDYLKARRSRGPVPDGAPLFAVMSNNHAGGHLTTRSISRIVKDAFRRIGLDSHRVTAHSLRHTAITLAIVGGAPLEQAQAMARHAKPETTGQYFHNLKRLENAAERYVNF